MKIDTMLGIGLVAAGVWGGVVAVPKGSVVSQPSDVTVAIDPDDIGGVVTSSNGPEAGVWVIAETRSLPTGFRKIVVTDDRGRYVVPDLPKGEYEVWVRGYGLIDSKRVKTTSGKQLNLTAV